MKPALHNSDVSIAIVGAGFAGLCMAIELRRAGIDNFTIYEANGEVGGTWYDNTYPGCACDIPSHLYSYSFDLNPDWTRAYSGQAEIQEYLVRCARKYDIYSHIQFNTEIQNATFDDASSSWTLRTTAGDVITAHVAVLGVGPLSQPNIPHFEGLDDFEGETCHSARWNHDADLRGKRVGVIGTGASAIQIVPAIAAEVGELTVFQRTPPWVVPKPDRAFGGWEKRLFAKVPGWQRAYRALTYWKQELQAVGFISDQRVMKAFQWFALRYIERSFGDPELRELVTPNYTIGCKRILLSNDYYPALRRPNVTLVPSAVSRFTSRGIVTQSGDEHELDAVIFATGFRITDFLAAFEITGRARRSLNEEWRAGAHAYYGIAVSGFPNLFMLVGPNTGLGHNSIIFMIEAQVRLVRQCLEAMINESAATIEVRPAIHRQFNETLQERIKSTVWHSGCQSWYLDDNGKNTTLWPGYTFEYWLRTRKYKPADFQLTRAPAR